MKQESLYFQHVSAFLLFSQVGDRTTFYFSIHIFTCVIVKIKGNNVSRPWENSIGDTGILHPRLNLM